MENSCVLKEMSVIKKARELMESCCSFTSIDLESIIDSNPKPIKYCLTLNARIESLSINIFENLLRANECSLAIDEERNKRFNCQQEVVVYCKLIDALFEIIEKTKLTDLSSKIIEYLRKLAVEIKKMTATWKNNDKKSTSKQNIQV